MITPKNPKIIKHNKTINEIKNLLFSLNLSFKISEKLELFSFSFSI